MESSKRVTRHKSSSRTSMPSSNNTTKLLVLLGAIGAIAAANTSSEESTTNTTTSNEPNLDEDISDPISMWIPHKLNAKEDKELELSYTFDCLLTELVYTNILGKEPPYKYSLILEDVYEDYNDSLTLEDVHEYYNDKLNKPSNKEARDYLDNMIELIKSLKKNLESTGYIDSDKILVTKVNTTYTDLNIRVPVPSVQWYSDNYTLSKEQIEAIAASNEYIKATVPYWKEYEAKGTWENIKIVKWLYIISYLLCPRVETLFNLMNTYEILGLYTTKTKLIERIYECKDILNDLQLIRIEKEANEAMQHMLDHGLGKIWTTRDVVKILAELKEQIASAKTLDELREIKAAGLKLFEQKKQYRHDKYSYVTKINQKNSRTFLENLEVLIDTRIQEIRAQKASKVYKTDFKQLVFAITVDNGKQITTSLRVKIEIYPTRDKYLLTIGGDANQTVYPSELVETIVKKIASKSYIEYTDKPGEEHAKLIQLHEAVKKMISLIR